VTKEEGNVVKLLDERRQQNAPPVLRRILYFLVPAREDQIRGVSVSAPLAWFKAERLPAGAGLYTNDPDPEPTLKMSCIDTTTTTEDAERLLSKQEEDLNLEMKIMSMVQYSGLTRPQNTTAGGEVFLGEIPINNILFIKLHIDIIQKNGTSLQGCLPHQKKRNKSICVVGRVHRIRKYTLFFVNGTYLFHSAVQMFRQI